MLLFWERGGTYGSDQSSFVGKASGPYLLWVAETMGDLGRKNERNKRIAIHSAENSFFGRNSFSRRKMKARR